MLLNLEIHEPEIPYVQLTRSYIVLWSCTGVQNSVNLTTIAACHWKTSDQLPIDAYILIRICIHLFANVFVNSTVLYMYILPIEIT